MKFVLTDKQVFWWPVTVKVPDPASPGQIMELGFEGRFEALPYEEAALIETNSGPGLTGAVKAQTALISRVLVSWRGVEDADGNDAPFSGDALTSACRNAWFRTGVLAAYVTAMAGEAARLKN